MGILRGIKPIPYGRRGVTGPSEVTVGGEWPWIRCWECDGWKDPKTGEHAKSMPLLDFLKNVCPDDEDGQK